MGRSQKETRNHENAKKLRRKPDNTKNRQNRKGGSNHQGGRVSSGESESKKSEVAPTLGEIGTTREAYRQRLAEKHFLDAQIQSILGGDTGVVEQWCHIENAMKSGDSAEFLTYVPKFIQNMKMVTPLVLQYDAIQSDEGLSEDDPLAVALNWKLDSKKLIQRMNNNAEKLVKCDFLDKKYVDADELIQWYQRNFEGKVLKYDENG